MARSSYLLQLINTFGILCMYRYTEVIMVSEREKKSTINLKKTDVFFLKLKSIKSYSKRKIFINYINV